MVHREDLLNPFKAAGDAGRRCIVDLVRCNKPSHTVQLVLVDDLVPTAEQGLVVSSRHVRVPFSGLLHSGGHPDGAWSSDGAQTAPPERLAVAGLDLRRSIAARYHLHSRRRVPTPNPARAWALHYPAGLADIEVA